MVPTDSLHNVAWQHVTHRGVRAWCSITGDVVPTRAARDASVCIENAVTLLPSDVRRRFVRTDDHAEAGLPADRDCRSAVLKVPAAVGRRAQEGNAG